MLGITCLELFIIEKLRNFLAPKVFRWLMIYILSICAASVVSQVFSLWGIESFIYAVSSLVSVALVCSQ